MSKTVVRSGMGLRRRNKLIFYVLMLALPVSQFCIFYFGVNINSILLAFKNYELVSGTYSYVGIANFAKVIADLGSLAYFKAAIKNSLIAYAASLLGMSLSIVFSFYIYKKYPMGNLFKVILFLPNILSGIVLVIMFKYFVDRAIPSIAEMLFGTKMIGLIANPSTVFPTVLFFGVWASFGGRILMFSGTMGGISESITEAAKLDGITPIKELLFIVLPLIWPTICTFLVVSVSGIFTSQMGLFDFFGLDAEYKLYTFGYFLYKAIKQARIADYPYLSAMGLLLTSLAIPMTFIAKWTLEKLGSKGN